MKSIAIAAMFAALVGACGGSATTTVTPPPAGSTIGPSGGTVTSSDGGAQLTFPAGALASSVNITTAAMTDPPASPGLIAALAYNFGPTGTQFAQPVTIKMTYQPSQVPAGVSPVFLRMFVRNGSAWDSVSGSSVDTAAHVITGTTTHFSGFAACGYPVCGPVSIGSSVAADFWQPCCNTLQQGGSVIVSGTIETINYSGSITTTVENLPTGVTGSIAVGPPPGQLGCATACYRLATLTLNAATSAVPGQYAINVRTSVGGSIADAVEPVPVMITAIPGYTLSVLPSPITIAQGSSANATATIARTLFTAPVTLSAGNLPSGVTASFNPAQLSGTTLSSVLTLTAGSSVTAATSNITVTGVAAGLANQVATVPLTVAAFAIVANPTNLTVAAGGTVTSTIKATRAGGFSGAITYTVVGVPSGLTATVTPTAVADSAVFSVTAALNPTQGSYPITVVGTSGAVAQYVTVLVTVGSTGLHYDWSSCLKKPIWFAYQDGNGPWTRLVGVGDVYDVPTLSSGKGAFAIAIPNLVGTGIFTSVDYGTLAELSVPVVCFPATVTTVNGTVSGLAASGLDWANIALGSASTTVTANGAFSLSFVAPGAHDLIAYLQSQSGDRLTINRGVSSPGAINMAAGSAPDTASVSVNGWSGGSLFAQMNYVTGACESGPMYYLQNLLSAPIRITGVPAARQLSTDFHLLSVTESGASRARTVTTMFHTLASMSVSLGASITPTITSLTGPYKRLQGVVSLPGDYGFVNMSITFPSTGNVSSLNSSIGYSGSANVTLAMPDLSGVAGFSSSWLAPTSDQAQFSFSAQSVLDNGHTQCTEGRITKSAYLAGTN